MYIIEEYKTACFQAAVLGTVVFNFQLRVPFFHMHIMQVKLSKARTQYTSLKMTLHEFRKYSLRRIQILTNGFSGQCTQVFIGVQNMW